MHTWTPNVLALKHTDWTNGSFLEEESPEEKGFPDETSSADCLPYEIAHTSSELRQKWE